MLLHLRAERKKYKWQPWVKESHLQHFCCRSPCECIFLPSLILFCRPSWHLFHHKNSFCGIYQHYKACTVSRGIVLNVCDVTENMAPTLEKWQVSLLTVTQTGVTWWWGCIQLLQLLHILVLYARLRVVILTVIYVVCMLWCSQAFFFLIGQSCKKKLEKRANEGEVCSVKHVKTYPN